MKFHYLGTDTQLGRFGSVTRGDILDLTAREEADITREKDKRFKPFDPKAKIVKTKLALPEGFDELSDVEQKATLRRLEQAEETRLADLARANERTASVELDDLSRDELLEKAEALRKEGKTVVFQKDANRSTIRDAIALALGQGENTGPDTEEETGGAIPPGGKAAGSPTGEGTGGAPITPAPEGGATPPGTGAAGTVPPSGPAGVTAPVVVPLPAIPAPEGVDDMTQAELDAEIAKLEAAGRPVTPASGKRVYKIAAIKAACEATKASA